MSRSTVNVVKARDHSVAECGFNFSSTLECLPTPLGVGALFLEFRAHSIRISQKPWKTPALRCNLIWIQRPITNGQDAIHVTAISVIDLPKLLLAIGFSDLQVPSATLTLTLRLELVPDYFAHQLSSIGHCYLREGTDIHGKKDHCNDEATRNSRY